ncbi:hypothetical protein ACFE04_021647 [Oxalis oulophora]
MDFLFAFFTDLIFSIDFNGIFVGSAKIISQAAAGNSETQEDAKDQNLAFVAGATGKLLRLAKRATILTRELLKLGFRVRAGVRSAQRAETLVQSVKKLKLDLTSDETQSVEKFELVEFDLEKPEQIVPALGNASLVICCIGASEKEVFDITGPYRIDYQATKNLIDAATIAKVNHFVMVSSLGTNKIGFPAAILNLFWGVLLWKRKAEEALIASGIPYTIVRPGGMERPTDAFKETHNITLSPEDTLFGGLVSNLQVAELIAVIAKNPSVSYFKVVEVVAETTAPLTPMEELLRKIPSARPDYYQKESAAPVPDPTPSVISKEQAESVPDLTPSQSVIPEKPSVPTMAQPLSPYTAYDDLKPPTSPSPRKPTIDAPVLSSNNTPQIEEKPIATDENEVPKPRPQSPFTIILRYDDLKPPSSPSPSSPTIEGSALPNNNSPTLVDEPSVKQELHESKTSSLSPFTMYEDLKPPSSPSPSTPL